MTSTNHFGIVWSDDPLRINQEIAIKVLLKITTVQLAVLNVLYFHNDNEANPEPLIYNKNNISSCGLTWFQRHSIAYLRENYQNIQTLSESYLNVSMTVLRFGKMFKCLRTSKTLGTNLPSVKRRTPILQTKDEIDGMQIVSSISNKYAIE